MRITLDTCCVCRRQIDWVKEQSSGGSESRAAVRIALGKHMSIDDRRYRVYRPHNSALSVLIIRRARRHDAGVYRCNLSGSTTRHKYMILNVTGADCMTDLHCVPFTARLSRCRISRYF